MHDANNYPASSIVDRLLYEHNPSLRHLIPTSSREKFRFNAWINAGGAPSDGNPSQIVISNFTFMPSSPPSIAGPKSASVPHSGSVAFGGVRTISISDKDAGISFQTVSMSVTVGTLEVDARGVSVIGGASGTSAVTIRGSLDKINSALATLKYSAPNAGSSAILTVTANDGTLNSNLLQSSIALTNIAPTLDAIPDPLPILEDAGPTQLTLAGISAGGSESQGLVLQATSSNPNVIPNPSIAYASPNSTGFLSYSPVPNQSGTVVITVTVIDDSGTVAGDSDRLTRSFVQQVIPVNDAPSFRKGADVFVSNSTNFHTFTGWATNIMTGPTEEFSQSLTFEVVADNPSLFQVPPTVDATGRLSFSSATSTGTATITVTLRDSGGTDNGGSNSSPSQTFTITVRNPSPWYNGLDVNRDDFITPLDVLLIINYLNAKNGGPIPKEAQPISPFLYVNDDLFVTVIDALLVINYLNSHSTGESESPASPPSDLYNSIADLLSLDIVTARNRRLRL